MPVHQTYAITYGPLDLTARERKRTVILPVRLREFGIEHLDAITRGVERLDPHPYRRLVTPRMVQRLHTRKLQSTHTHSPVKPYIDRIWLRRRRRCQTQSLTAPAAEQTHPVGPDTSFGLQRHERPARILGRSWEREYRHITVIAPLIGTSVRQGQYDTVVAALHVGTAPCKMAHCIFGFDPRAARHGPTRTPLHGETQSQTPALGRRMAYGVVPPLAQTRYARIVAGPHAVIARLPVKQLHARETGRRDSLQIGRNTLRRDVASDIVEPRLRAEYLRRIGKGRYVICSEFPVENRLRRHGLGC